MEIKADYIVLEVDRFKQVLSNFIEKKSDFDEAIDILSNYAQKITFEYKIEPLEKEKGWTRP